jgi:hypothetical protein
MDKRPRPKPKSSSPPVDPLRPDPKAWLPLRERKGFVMIPHSLDTRKHVGMLPVYREGMSYKPQLITKTGTRFDGATLHLMSMSSRHLAEDTGLHRETCAEGLRHLIEDGWAARIRTGKKGQRNTAAYVFFSAEEREQFSTVTPKVTQGHIGTPGVPNAGSRIGTPGVPMIGTPGVPNTPRMTRSIGTPDRNEVSPVSEGQLKALVPLSIVDEPSAAEAAALREKREREAREQADRRVAFRAEQEKREAERLAEHEKNRRLEIAMYARTVTTRMGGTISQGIQTKLDRLKCTTEEWQAALQEAQEQAEPVTVEEKLRRYIRNAIKDNREIAERDRRVWLASRFPGVTWNDWQNLVEQEKAKGAA